MAERATWVLVADAARARVFESDAKAGTLVQPALHEAVSEAAPSRDIASDRPGRTFDRAGEGRHAKEPPTDPHRYEKRRFAHGLAELLDEERKKDAFAELVIVAPPQMLGDLRNALSEEVRKRVRAEIGKDLSMLAPREIEEHLAEVLRR